MAVYFFDSNAIVKYYLTEPGSIWVRRIVDAEENTCLISDISIAEVAAAMAQIQRHSSFGRDFMKRMNQQFQADIKRHVWLTHATDIATVEYAAEIARSYIIKGCDAIQVASAVIAEEYTNLEIIFVSGDKQALRTARFEALIVDNPFEHIDEDALPQ